jgi:hypothetical protein
MRNERLFRLLCLVLFAGGALLVFRGLRHSAPVPVPEHAPLPAAAGADISPAASRGPSASDFTPVPAAGTAEILPEPVSPAPPAGRTPLPSPSASEIHQVSVEDFLARPDELDRHPMEVGRCRLVEHWNTGYCYVYGLSFGRKISERADARCDDLPELRRRMRAAVDRGDCR